MTQVKLHAVPITIKAARRYSGTIHRHLKGCTGGLYAAACADPEGRICGVVIVGRPARLAQDGETCEVTRCATDGTPNACSFLYSLARRVAQTLGYRRCLTKTLTSESGASLRALGLVPLGKTRAQTWNRPSRARRSGPLDGQQKLRWDLLAESA